jgi:hypothetical protein
MPGSPASVTATTLVAGAELCNTAGQGLRQADLKHG